MPLLDDLIAKKDALGQELIAATSSVNSIAIDGLSFAVRTVKEITDDLKAVSEALAREEGPTEQHSIWIIS